MSRIRNPLGWLCAALAIMSLSLSSYLQARDSIHKCFYQEHPATGTCGEYCLTDLGDCGGACPLREESNCEPPGGPD